MGYFQPTYAATRQMTLKAISATDQYFKLELKLEKCNYFSLQWTYSLVMGADFKWLQSISADYRVSSTELTSKGYSSKCWRNSIVTPLTWHT